MTEQAKFTYCSLRKPLEKRKKKIKKDKKIEDKKIKQKRKNKQKQLKIIESICLVLMNLIKKNLRVEQSFFCKKVKKCFSLYSYSF